MDPLLDVEPLADGKSMIDLSIKLALSVFLAFHLWFNLHFYGPLNYLWFCDIALLMCFVGVWTENRLLLSMCALSSLGPATIWSVDLFLRAMTGQWFIGMASYMTARAVPLPVRMAATFHLWMPILLLWCLKKLRYDRRALIYQTFFAIALLIVCRVFTAPPPEHSPSDEVNINFVYGYGDAPQTEMPAWLYLTRMICLYWFLMYLPIHVALLKTLARQNQIASMNNHAGTMAGLRTSA